MAHTIQKTLQGYFTIKTSSHHSSTLNKHVKANRKETVKSSGTVMMCEGRNCGLNAAVGDSELTETPVPNKSVKTIKNNGGHGKATKPLLVQQSLFLPTEQTKQSSPDKPQGCGATPTSTLCEQIKTAKKHTRRKRAVDTTDVDDSETPVMKKRVKNKDCDVDVIHGSIPHAELLQFSAAKKQRKAVKKPSRIASIETPVDQVRSMKKKGRSMDAMLVKPGKELQCSPMMKPENAKEPSEAASIPVDQVKHLKKKSQLIDATLEQPGDELLQLRCTPVGKPANDCVTINKMKIYYKEIDSIRNGEWLSCKVIESYLHLLSVAARLQNKYFRIWTSRMWTLYTEKGLQRIDKWLEKKAVNVDDDYVIQVINHSDSHWTAIWMDCKRKVLTHLDPIGKCKEESHLLKQFQTLIEYHSGQQFDWENWSHTVQEMRKQDNGNDCGVFVCAYARCLLGLSDGAWLERENMAQELTATRILPIIPVKAIEIEDESEDDDSGPREDMTDSDSSPAPFATPKEKYLNGLLKGPALSRRNVHIGYIDGRGRSAFAAKYFQPGDFVCEYGAVRRVSEKVDKGEERNAQLGLGCFCLDAHYEGVKYTFDASPKCNDPGRYINHAKCHPNLQLMAPLMIGRPPHEEAKLRIGFVAKKAIKQGDELFFDYGVKDQDINWANADASKIAIKLQDADLGPLSTSNEWRLKLHFQEGQSLSPVNGTTSEPAKGSSQKRRKPPNRTRKYCNICKAPIVKLTQHLLQHHNILDRTKRIELSKSAEKVQEQKLPQHESSNSDHENMGPPQKRNKREKNDSDRGYNDDHNTIIVNEDDVMSIPKKKKCYADYDSDSSFTSDDLCAIEKDETDDELLVERYHFEQQSNNPAFYKDSFAEYLLDLCGGKRSEGTAQSAAKSVHYFFTYKQYSQGSLHDIILNKTNIRDYVHHLEKVKNYAGSTIKERIAWLNDAIEYLTERSGSSVKLHIRKKEIKETINTIKKGLATITDDQRNEQARLSHAKVNSEESATAFLTNKNLQQEASKAIIKAKDNNVLTSVEHKLVLGYLAAQLIYMNAQRSGVVQYMTIDEYLARKQVQNTIVIQVHKHKTSRKKGPAQIVIDSKIVIDHLNDYFEYIRKPLVAASRKLEERMFLMQSGMEFRKVYEVINDIAEKFSLTLPTPTTHRKMVSTDASEELASQDVEILQAHMSHSRKTAERYYQKKTIDAAVRSHLNISKIVQNRGFTQQHNACIMKEWPLTACKAPPLSLCRLIGSKHNIDKTPQQIQDRWKYLCKKRT